MSQKTEPFDYLLCFLVVPVKKGFSTFFPFHISQKSCACLFVLLARDYFSTNAVGCIPDQPVLDCHMSPNSSLISLSIPSLAIVAAFSLESIVSPHIEANLRISSEYIFCRSHNGFLTKISPF